LQLTFARHWHSKQSYLCTSSNLVAHVVIVIHFLAYI